MFCLKSYNYYLKISQEVFKGKDLSRTLTNLKLGEEDILLSGRILDLGGRDLYWKNGKPLGGSYLRFLKFDKKVEILRLDIDRETKPDYKIDFEKDSLPFKKNSIDAILIFNLFEHIYNYNFLIKEIFRVLKPGGLVVGSVPFLIRIHPDPKDFFRYTKQALKQIFKENNFSKIEIKYVGYGPIVNQYSQIEFIFPRACRLFFNFFSIILDKIILRLKPFLKERFPLNYLFILKNKFY
ncbi:hypothetical protein ES703_15217 [subsurface metagenome]